MEELQSTEILDREILEDARRKAQRLLKTADETVAAAEASWAKKTSETLDTLRKTYERRLERSRDEIMARLPLDKQRNRLKKIEGLLRTAAADYLGGLSRQKTLELLAAALAKRAGEFAADEPDSLRVSFRGLDTEELGKIMGAVLPGRPWAASEVSSGSPALPGSFPLIRVDAPALRVTVSVESEVEALLLDKRAELAGALIGEAALLGEQYA